MAKKKAEAIEEVKPSTNASLDLSSLGDRELRGYIDKMWGNDGNVIVASNVPLSNPKVLPTLQKLMDSPYDSTYAPDTPDGDPEWMERSINFVSFKVRRNVRVTLPKQMIAKIMPNVRPSSSDNYDLSKNPEKKAALT